MRTPTLTLTRTLALFCSGHVILMVFGTGTLLIAPFFVQYITQNDLWETFFLNLLLSKCGAVITGFATMGLVFHVLWSVQCRSDRNLRYGGHTFYIQWDDKDWCTLVAGN